MNLPLDLIRQKKGILIIGTPRCGSHHVSNGIFRMLSFGNKEYVGELYLNYDPENIEKNIKELQNNKKFVVGSLVRWIPKNLLVQHLDEFNDFYLINLRRLDKVAQYRSWCAARLTWKYSFSHSIEWSKIENDLPYPVTNQDLDQFIIEQNTDYLWDCDQILYYDQLDLKSFYQKTDYALPNEKIFSDYNLVLKRLKNFKYVK